MIMGTVCKSSITFRVGEVVNFADDVEIHENMVLLGIDPEAKSIIAQRLGGRPKVYSMETIQFLLALDCFTEESREFSEPTLTLEF